MSEISVVVVGSTSVNSVVGNGDSVNVSIGGDAGGSGSAATIQVGTVSTLEPTQSVSIVNVGTSYAAKLNFGIPRGQTGSTGPVGPVASLQIGTVQAGPDASATITGSGQTQTLNLVLPQGATGPQGTQGAVGPAGPPNVLTVGSVTTTDATTAAVSIVGTSPSQVVSFVLPRGPQGTQGDPGPFTVVQAGSVATGVAGTQAKVDTVAVGGTVTLNFTIPRGADGTSNLGDETPQPLGVASAGSAVVAARADHVHALPAISYGSLTGVPSTFVAAAHTHAISEVTNLQAVLDSKQAAGSYATLINGLVPSSQLPGFVDDVVEAASYATLPATGESGKLYVAVDTRKLWRWSGSAYVEIASSPGSTDSVTEGATNLYFTNARAAAAAPVQSVNGKTGNVTIEAGGIAWSSVPTATTTVTKAGALSYDENYLYVANATDQWRRSAIEDWTTPTISISAQPSDQTAVGGTATFAVAATATQNAELLYQWQRQAGGTGSWTNIATGLSATLSLADLSYAANNGDKYRVVITSGAAGTGGTAVNGWLPAVVVELTPAATITSGEAILTVAAAISIVAQPQNVSLTNGTAAAFSVTATTPGTGLSYQWQSSPDGTNWTNISGATSASYSLAGITETANDNYRYRCIVSSSGYADATSNAALLDVAPITVTSQPSSATGSPVAGTTPNYSASFTSSATSPAGAPTIQWEVSADGGTTYSDVSGQTSSSLSLTGLTNSDSGKKYRAKFEKSGWNTVRSSVATLTVPLDAITVTQQPSNTTASVSSYGSTAFALPTGRYTGISYAGGKWFATPSNADLGGDYMATSSDGVNWSKQTLALPIVDSWSRVLYYNGVYLTHRGFDSGKTPQYATSTDGQAWTSRYNATLGSVAGSASSVMIVPGVGFVTANPSGNSAYSADGVAWATCPANGGSQYAQIGDRTVSVAATESTIGGFDIPVAVRIGIGNVTKTVVASYGSDPHFFKTAFVGVAGEFFVVYSNSFSNGLPATRDFYLLSFADATSTTPTIKYCNLPGSNFDMAVAVSGSRLVAAGSAGFYTSSDSGTSWALRYSAGLYNSGTGQTDGRFFVSGTRVLYMPIGDSSNRTVYTSDDSGLNWTARTFALSVGGSNSTVVPFAVNGKVVYEGSNSTTSFGGSIIDPGGITSASFASSATTTFGAPAIQWQRSTDGGATWANVSGAVSSPYQFTPSSGDNGARYRAVHSKDGYATVNSNSATLTVP